MNDDRKVTRLPGAEGGPEIDINDRINMARQFIARQIQPELEVLKRMIAQGITPANAPVLELIAAIKTDAARQMELAETRILIDAGVRFTGTIEIGAPAAPVAEVKPLAPVNDEDEQRAREELEALREQRRRENHDD